jgi:hypothetical protein
VYCTCLSELKCDNTSVLENVLSQSAPDPRFSKEQNVTDLVGTDKQIRQLVKTVRKRGNVILGLESGLRDQLPVLQLIQTLLHRLLHMVLQHNTDQTSVEDPEPDPYIIKQKR